MENIGTFISLISFSIVTSSFILFLITRFKIIDFSNKYLNHSWDFFNSIIFMFVMTSIILFFISSLFFLDINYNFSYTIYFSLFLLLSISPIALTFYIKSEKFKDIERIKFFSAFTITPNTFITINQQLPTDDLTIIKDLIFEQIKLDKSRFDKKAEITFQINEIDFVVIIPISFNNYLKLQTGTYSSYEFNTYDYYSILNSVSFNDIQGIEFKDERDGLNIWSIMNLFGYSSLFEINKDSLKLYEMIKI